MDKKIAVIWDKGPVNGSVEVVNGALAAGSRQQVFSVGGTKSARLEVCVADARLEAGANPTLVQLHCAKSPITIILRDVCRATPVYVPEYGVVVTASGDSRTYAQIVKAIRAKKLKSGLQRIAAAPEESFAAAAAHNLDMECPVWLGVSRDMRMFRFAPEDRFGYWGYVQPMHHSYKAAIPEADGRDYTYRFVLGPGSSCRSDITRRLDDGVLPIVQSEQVEGDVTYALTAFATLERQPLSAASVQGSDWRAAYAFTGGNMYKDEDRQRLRAEIEAETTGRTEQVVCCVRAVAINNGRVPRHAWFKALKISTGKAHAFDGARGFATLGKDRVYGLHRLNGAPMPQEEMAVLLPPGGRAVLEMLVPHTPLGDARAAALAALDFDRHLQACRAFWRGKLAQAARVRVPEPAIDERIRAGLLHLEINSIGREPDGALMACVGGYAPIGSESAPMIQFFDSMGCHAVAERCLDFFLERQREDGFIQNFGGYQLETGPFLWTCGEHFRYTRDTAWVRRVKDKLLKAGAFLLAWRARNQREEIRGNGFGLLDGKVADPEDFFHSYMLNGLSYAGLARLAEMLAQVDPAESNRLAAEAAAYREDIRISFGEALARSPVAPLGDGTWAPAPPPWSEYRGPLALYAEGGNWFTHGAFGSRDSLIGSLYLPIGGVLDPSENASTFLLKTHQELFTKENAGLSQPYYPRHDWMHLKRGEVKAFLKTYYNQVTALQDRQAYTFWEHYFHASQHKTHEEAWFLMQTRWMLWLEEGDTLSLLKCVPRAWLEHGQRIELRNVATYFGKLSLTVLSQIGRGAITARVQCTGRRCPKTLIIRLPHPAGLPAKKATGGHYDPATESVTIPAFTGRAQVKLVYPRSTTTNA